MPRSLEDILKDYVELRPPTGVLSAHTLKKYYEKVGYDPELDRVYSFHLTYPRYKRGTYSRFTTLNARLRRSKLLAAYIKPAFLVYAQQYRFSDRLPHADDSGRVILRFADMRKLVLQYMTPEQRSSISLLAPSNALLTGVRIYDPKRIEVFCKAYEEHTANSELPVHKDVTDVLRRMAALFKNRRNLALNSVLAGCETMAQHIKVKEKIHRTVQKQMSHRLERSTCYLIRNALLCDLPLHACAEANRQEKKSAQKEKETNNDD